MENEELKTLTADGQSNAETMPENVPADEKTHVQTDNPQMPESDIDALIAEAEQRGYNRGLNEQMARSLNEPGVFEDLSRKSPTSTHIPDETDQSLTSRFLTEIRPCVWDNL